MKEGSAKAGLRLNIKKTKVMITEDIPHFHRDSEDTEIVTGFADRGSIINSNGDCSQEIMSRRRRTALGQVTEGTGVSAETS